MERLGQLATLGSLFAAVGIGSKQLIRVLSRLTGKRNSTVAATLMGSIAVVAMAKTYSWPRTCRCIEQG